MTAATASNRRLVFHAETEIFTKTQTKKLTKFQMNNMEVEQKVPAAASAPPGPQGTRFLRLRGLPFTATDDEVRQFLIGKTERSDKGHIVKSIAGVQVDAVYLTLTNTGRPSGEAYVEVKTEADVTNGLALDKKEMKTRYIEGSLPRTISSFIVFAVSADDLERVRSQGLINDNGKVRALIPRKFDPQQVVRLRGIPFSATENDIRKFFEGMISSFRPLLSAARS